jgi:aminomethyltransferase
VTPPLDDTATDVTARYSPLHQLHVDAGASFTDFAGWHMPVRYSSDLAEHHAVRTSAGIFDISHMAEISVTGPDAARLLDYALAGNISTVAFGRAKYSLLLDESGGILDDLLVYAISEEEYFVVANAGNRAAVVAAIRERGAELDADVDDLTDDIVLIAVQGPHSKSILKSTAGLDIEGLAELRYYAFTGSTFAGASVLVARTGYTGEDGYELYVPVQQAVELWNALGRAGQPLGLAPCGLASRDTLRLEAGMPLYGHELGPDVLPEQVGLGSVVSLKKEGSFVGRDAVTQGASDDSRVLVGLIAGGKRAGRAGYAVMNGEAEVGVVTSGALSPTLGYPIAMAFVDRSSSVVGSDLTIDVRGSRTAATVVALPFYKREI